MNLYRYKPTLKIGASSKKLSWLHTAVKKNEKKTRVVCELPAVIHSSFHSESFISRAPILASFFYGRGVVPWSHPYFPVPSAHAVRSVRSAQNDYSAIDSRRPTGAAACRYTTIIRDRFGYIVRFTSVFHSRDNNDRNNNIILTVLLLNRLISRVVRPREGRLRRPA